MRASPCGEAGPLRLLLWAIELCGEGPETPGGEGGWGELQGRSRAHAEGGIGRSGQPLAFLGFLELPAGKNKPPSPAPHPEGGRLSACPPVHLCSRQCLSDPHPRSCPPLRTFRGQHCHAGQREAEGAGRPPQVASHGSVSVCGNPGQEPPRGTCQLGPDQLVGSRPLEESFPPPPLPHAPRALRLSARAGR